MLMRRRLLRLTHLFALASAMTACSAGGSGGLGAASGGSGGTASSGGGSGAAGPSGAYGSGGVGDITVGLRDAATSAPSGDACAAISVPATSVPVDMYLMLDSSRTMTCAVTGGATRWDAFKGAIQQFVNLPAADGLGVGIQYFGLDNASCSAALYASPSVPIAPLPGNRTKIVDSLNARQPDAVGPAPISAALEGAIDHARVFARANPGHVVAVVLVTDGEPLACGDLAAIDGIAAAGLAQSPSIRTYVIGFTPDIRCYWDNGLADPADLNGVAESGGTTQAVFVQPGVDAVQEFLSSIQKVQERTKLPCTYQIPPPTMGNHFDFFNVNVKFTSGEGRETDVLSAGTAAECARNAGGWYYDDPKSPTTIKLCPETCAAVSLEAKGRVDILVGCEPKGVPPPIAR
jgi:hypothetical protein